MLEAAVGEVRSYLRAANHKTEAHIVFHNTSPFCFMPELRLIMMFLFSIYSHLLCRVFTNCLCLL